MDHQASMDHMLRRWKAEKQYKSVQLQLEMGEIFNDGQEHVLEIFNSIELSRYLLGTSNYVQRTYKGGRDKEERQGENMTRGEC